MQLSDCLFFYLDIHCTSVSLVVASRVTFRARERRMSCQHQTTSHEPSICLLRLQVQTTKKLDQILMKLYSKYGIHLTYDASTSAREQS